MNDSYENNPSINDEYEEEENPVITLLDDNGEEVHFEILDAFEYMEKHYTVLLPYEEGEEEVVILEVKHGEDEDEFLSVNDENLLYEIFEEFKKRNKDNFNFAD